jgi:carboxyl-terminal processing protease
VREADLQKHLGNDKEDSAAQAADAAAEAARNARREADEQRLLQMAKKYKPVEFGSRDDFQLAQALNHFKGLPVKLARGDAAPAAGAAVGEIKSDSGTDASVPAKAAPAAEPKAKAPAKPAIPAVK